ncbi:MAG TPA: CoA-binding protein, partial [Deinococcales bacterium]|nr:CoA-binding protein [Deinococcales bacterium]
TEEAAERFLQNKRIAVTGVSRRKESHGSNVVAQRLLERGYQVFQVNPNAAEIDGRPCYPSLAAIPGGVEAVVIATRPEHADTTMQEVVKLGIPMVWMHRAFGTGSVSPAATRYGRDHGVTVIDGGCPLMFGPTADGGHRFMCRLMTFFGSVPRTVA